MWNWIWFIMAFWTLIKDSKYKKYFGQHRYSLSRSAFSILVIIPLGYKPLRSISSSKTPCEDGYTSTYLAAMCIKDDNQTTVFVFWLVDLEVSCF